MNANRKKWLSILERVGTTFAETFLATLIASNVFDQANFHILALWQQAALAGGASVASLLKSLVAVNIGNIDTPALLPAKADPATTDAVPAAVAKQPVIHVGDVPDEVPAGYLDGQAIQAAVEAGPVGAQFDPPDVPKRDARGRFI